MTKTFIVGIKYDASVEYEIEADNIAQAELKAWDRFDHADLSGDTDIEYVIEANNPTMPSDASKWTALQKAYAALLEASSLFDNYPQTFEAIGTYQVIHNALNDIQAKLNKETK